MFSAKLNAFESILLVCIFLRTSRLRCDGRVYLKGLRSKPPFVRYRKIYSCKVKPPLSKFLVKPLIKKKHLDFLCENCYSSI